MSRGKLEFALYYFYDHTTMEQHFEKMSLKGWALDRMGIFWHYHRIVPRMLHYAVGYFPGGGIYTPPSGEELTFEEYCRLAGWELAAEYGTMKIFCNERENPVPLDTQADIQVENIRKGSRRFRIADGILGVIGWLITFYFLINLYFDGTRTLSSGTECILAFICCMMGIYAADEFITYQCWYKRAKINAERDQSFTPTKGHPLFMKIVMLLIVGTVIVYAFSIGGILVLLIAGGYCLVYYFQDIIRNHMRNRGSATVVNIAANFAMAFLIFFLVWNGYYYFHTSGIGEYYEKNGFYWEGAKNPLTLQVLAEPEFDGKGYIDTQSIQSSIFLSRIAVEQFYNEALSGAEGDSGYYLEYVVTKVNMEVFYGFARSSMERTYGNKENWQPVDSWGIGKEEEVQVRRTDFDREGQQIFRYLLCMKDRIVKIDLSFEPDKEQQVRILDILGNI